ncbi:pyocin knob domain-containing protein [Psychrobacter namhaensis]|uniref:pyocin knob domain-containing protein n=1 Tax=Psychrobacter namhaensis TaxID=292734 RepID=UPI003D049F81
MAVQIPDPGTGNGQTGDNEYVFRKKVKDNFSDQTNAASRIVGPAAGQIPTSENTFTAQAQEATSLQPLTTGLIADFPIGVKVKAVSGGSYADKPVKESGATDSWAYRTENLGGTSYSNAQFAYPYRDADIYFRIFNYNPDSWSGWAKLLHTQNTTKDANGFVKRASPVVDLYNDRIELNHDAEKQGPTFEKLGVGNYLVKGSLGFAQAGWYIEMPKDANGNVLVAVVYEQLENNDLSIKTYAKKFDEETGDIVANILKPRDITEGRFISLRLHEVVDEVEPETET